MPASGAKSALRRLPLLAFMITGVVCLRYADGRLASDYRKSAADLAVQADALIESAVDHRATLLQTLAALVAGAETPRERRSRFAAFGEATRKANPDVLTLYYLDDRAAVREVFPALPARGDLTSGSHLLGETQAAVTRAKREDAPAATHVLVLRPDTLGFLVYAPVRRDERVVGYVAAAIAYGPLLRALLAERLEGRFGYRISVGSGTVLAISPEYPRRVAQAVAREVTLPGGESWLLEVPVGVFEPRTARAMLWVVGAALLFAVFLLVLRENARAERIAMHSFNLELLSRDLLDANVRLEERTAQIAEANRAKSRFLANVSHELRTPLNAIVGYNDLVLSGMYGEPNAEMRAAHERIRTAADHLLGVVDDVLDLAKIEVGKMAVERREVDLETLLEDVVSVVEPTAEAKGLRVDVVVARDLPKPVTDARHVRQVLLNLVANAIKYTERGAVTLVAKRSEQAGPPSVQIAVEDTGIGVDTHDLDRIFEEFEQVRPPGRGDSIVRGTGLGLAVARKLARLLEGDVTAESQIGSGSRFTLSLPIAPTTVGAGREATSSIEDTPPRPMAAAASGAVTTAVSAHPPP